MNILINPKQYKGLVLEARSPVYERIKIYEDENYLAVCPLTHAASCKYGSSSKWCTAVPSNDEHFHDYMGKGVLVYVIIKNPIKSASDDDKLRGEYKLACYYYPDDEYDNDEEYEWYDMSDNQVVSNDFDNKIIRFLLPSFLLQKIYTFTKNYKKNIDQYLKKNLNIYDVFMKNSGKQHVIVEDDDWALVKDIRNLYKINPNMFSERWVVLLDDRSQVNYFFINKKNNEILNLSWSKGFNIRNQQYRNCIGDEDLSLGLVYVVSLLDENANRNRIDNYAKKLYNKFKDGIINYFDIQIKTRPKSITKEYVVPELLSDGDVILMNTKIIVKNVKKMGNEYKIIGISKTSQNSKNPKLQEFVIDDDIFLDRYFK